MGQLGTSATQCGLWGCHDYEWPPAWLGKNYNSQEITSKKVGPLYLLPSNPWLVELMRRPTTL